MRRDTVHATAPMALHADWTRGAGQFTRWDWRAVANFIGGGTGAGVMLAATLFAPSIEVYRAQTMLALTIITIGLLCILLKLGHPERAANILRHAKGSWMTREGLAIPTLFGCGVISLWQSSIGVAAVIALLSALVFLYCQARILNEAKGIPAWSIPEIMPLIVSTGLAEGVGIAAVVTTIMANATPPAVVALLIITVFLRLFAWRRYRSGLMRAKAPQQVIDTLNVFARRWRLPGGELPLLLAFTGWLLGGFVGSIVVAIAGIAAAVAGWMFKATLLTRAGHYRDKGVSLAAGLQRARERTKELKPRMKH